jgi:adenine deaminase
MNHLVLYGNIVDIPNKEIFWGAVIAENGIITELKKLEKERKSEHYILPGFIDSHVHIESSMLVPSEFARLAVVHGTVGTISDPHEIANVCGLDGVKYMIQNAASVPFKCRFGAPSCVPATDFETAGARLDLNEVKELLMMPEISYLSEMMNFPGVLNEDADVMQKIAEAKKLNKPVDGHAPGLNGADAIKYIEAGISTDHECFTPEEALHKLQNGMKILIREGSAARNFEALINLLHDYEDMMMFCSDDKHPDSLAEGHIDRLCARAVAEGLDLFKVLKAACINPVKHYTMGIGLLNPGDPADMIVVDDLRDFKVKQTYIDGILVADKGKSLIKTTPADIINNFNCHPIQTSQLSVSHQGESEISVIEALDGQLITNHILCTPKVIDGMVVSDTENDVLKIVVVNRYKDAPLAKGFIKNIGLKNGAIASSVAHDSHNIVAVGTNDNDLCKAINAVIFCRGGISAVVEDDEKVLPLPVAGLMSNNDGYHVAEAYTAIDHFTKSKLGSSLRAPFMTLSFMALLVIPHIKLSDLGLFDSDKFTFMS